MSDRSPRESEPALPTANSTRGPRPTVNSDIAEFSQRCAAVQKESVDARVTDGRVRSHKRVDKRAHWEARYGESGMSREEVAEELGLTPGTVRVIENMALKKLSRDARVFALVRQLLEGRS